MLEWENPMKDFATNRRDQRKAAYAGVALGISYWIIESIIDTHVHDLGPFIERALSPDLNEMMMRSLASGLLIAFGFYAQIMINKVERAEEKLARMNECFLAFGPDPEDNINRLTALCGELLGATAAFYNRLEQDLLCSWGQWNPPADFTTARSPEGCACYDVIQHGDERALVIPDLQQSKYAGADPSVLRYGLKTYIGQAVRLGDEVVGSLCAVYKDDCAPGEEEKKFLGIIAAAVGVEEVRRRSRGALRDSEDRLRHLSAQLISAQEMERKRVARQLHDSIGQSLSAIKYSIEETLEQMEQNGADHNVKRLEAAVPLIQQVVDEVRRMQKSLRPSMLDDLGIIATISWFCRDFQTIYSGIRIEKEIEIHEDNAPEELKTTIYRIMQEAMNNVAKHSKADLARLSLTKTEHGLELAIEDNGSGFDVEKTLSAGSKSGAGLTSMRERTELSGGTFSIKSSAQTGTEVKSSWMWEKIQARD